MNTILVTGGCGYIGSHTIVDLVQNGYNVISIDNNSRSEANVMQGVEAIIGKSIKNYAIDLCDLQATEKIFIENPNITGIIHFAAYKAVGESVNEPLLYYHNNLESLHTILFLAKKYNVGNFVFSSSCTVYGNPDEQQVTELTPQKPAESPYGATKQMGETIVKDSSSNGLRSILLRYFNPVGAHHSLNIGELPIGKPANLVPAITQTAIGKLPQMQVFGNDYDTRDGSCVRDFIHVCDIAHAHTLALNYLIKQKSSNAVEVFNLGTGSGYTVLEAIGSFEKVSGVKLNYIVGPRRAGDVVAIYANNTKATTALGWQPKFGIDDMMLTAWQWELKLAEAKTN
jgi:UDP-glucose 4-epimerase